MRSCRREERRLRMHTRFFCRGPRTRWERWRCTFEHLLERHATDCLKPLRRGAPLRCHQVDGRHSLLGCTGRSPRIFGRRSSSASRCFYKLAHARLRPLACTHILPLAHVLTHTEAASVQAPLAHPAHLRFIGFHDAEHLNFVGSHRAATGERISIHRCSASDGAAL